MKILHVVGARPNFMKIAPIMAEMARYGDAGVSFLGEVIYDDGRLRPGARFWSSPVGFEGRILVSDDGGASHVIRAGPAFEVLATNKIDEPIWASPALSNGQILIRGDKSLYAFQRSP